MRNTKIAFLWITDILRSHAIPFQISGGFAAKIYGSERELADIDIDLPESRFKDILPEIYNYITFGPDRYTDDNWKLNLITVVYAGQEIDLGGTEETELFNMQNSQWEKLETDFSNTELVEVFGQITPVISMQELIKYKSLTCREVDVIDIDNLTD